MEIWRKPILRVPLVLCGLGIVSRLLSFVLGMIWGRILIAMGSSVISTGPIGVIHLVISCALFWLAGWYVIRGFSRREIFLSASIMVLVNAALLAAEQIGQAASGMYPLWVYRIYFLAEGSQWVSQMLFRIFDTVSVPLAAVGVFAPYLYLIFAKKDAPV